MKHRLPTLIAAAWLLWAASGPAAEGPLDLVGQAALRLQEAAALQAKVRIRTDLFGHQLAGTGEYVQAGDGPDQWLRLELRFQTTAGPVNLLQVCDGRFLWTRRQSPEGVQLTRIDLRRVRGAAAGQPPPAKPLSHWIALGGLARLLAALDANFQFDPPVADYLAGIPVWVLQGRWRPERLRRLLPQDHPAAAAANQPQALRQLPPHLPHAARLVLGRDNTPPLFPYRIDYLRLAKQDEDKADDADARWRSIVTLELYEVRLGGYIDPSLFVYQPGDQEVTDVTDEVIQQLTQPPP